MREAFGPDDSLKMHEGGFDRTVTSTTSTPAQLEMAELVHDAFERATTPSWKRARGPGRRCIPTAGDLQRAARGDFHGDEIAAGTALPKDIPFLQKHFAPNLKVAVMRAGRISVPREAASDGGPADAERHG